MNDEVLRVAAGFLAAYVIVPLATGWVRHRPRNLWRGTQHILLIGMLVHLIVAGFAWFQALVVVAGYRLRH